MLVEKMWYIVHSTYIAVKCFLFINYGVKMRLKMQQKPFQLLMVASWHAKIWATGTDQIPFLESAKTVEIHTYCMTVPVGVLLLGTISIWAHQIDMTKMWLA